MALDGLELHHHALRIQPGAEEAQVGFFRDVLGLHPDPGRPTIPDVALIWFDVGNDTQVHNFSLADGVDYAFDGECDPFSPHVAFGCPDVDAAAAELERAGLRYWSAGRGERRQLFTKDPSGNLIELHQIGTCRCKASAR